MPCVATVELRNGVELGMPKHVRDLAYPGASFQRLDSKTVTKHVRRHARNHAGVETDLLGSPAQVTREGVSIPWRTIRVGEDMLPACQWLPFLRSALHSAEHSRQHRIERNDARLARLPVRLVNFEMN